jgi:transcriptional regulator with XRE-family HTH domain
MKKKIKSQGESQKLSSGQVLRKIREAHSLTQKRLGELSGISEKSIFRWENDLIEPRLTIRQIAYLYDALNLDKAKIPLPFFFE